METGALSAQLDNSKTGAAFISAASGSARKTQEQPTRRAWIATLVDMTVHSTRRWATRYYLK